MLKLSLALALSLLVCACASHYGAAQIISIPSGAEVVSGKDGSSLGVTPTTVVWKDRSANRQHLILRFKKVGYYEKVSSFWLHMLHSSSEKAEQSPDLVEVILQKNSD